MIKIYLFDKVATNVCVKILLSKKIVFYSANIRIKNINQTIQHFQSSVFKK